MASLWRLETVLKAWVEVAVAVRTNFTRATVGRNGLILCLNVWHLWLSDAQELSSRGSMITRSEQRLGHDLRFSDGGFAWRAEFLYLPRLLNRD